MCVDHGRQVRKLGKESGLGRWLDTCECTPGVIPLPQSNGRWTASPMGGGPSSPDDLPAVASEICPHGGPWNEVATGMDT